MRREARNTKYIVTVALIVLSACAAVDDVARTATRAGATRSRAAAVIDDIARASGRSVADLASDLATSSEGTVAAIDDLWTRVRARASEVGTSALCDVLSDAVLEPGLTESDLEEMLADALIGLGSGAIADIVGVLRDVEDGQVSPLWVRVTYLKIKHC